MLRSAVIFVITVLWFGVFAPLGLDFHHDGVMFIPALRVASGEMVFRDVFCQYGLLSPLLQGMAVRLGGGELLAMKYFSVLFYGGIALLLDRVWRPLLPARWRNFILLMFWVLMPDTMVTFHAWSSIFALFFSLAALALLLKYLDCRQWWFAMFAGVAAGLTFLSRHPVGVVTVIALLLSFFFEFMLTAPDGRKLTEFARNCGWLLAGVLLVTAAGAIFLICNGAWDDFVLQCWGFVLNFVHKRGGNGSWGYFTEALFPFTTDFGLWDSLFGLLPLAALMWLFLGVRSANANETEKARNLKICVLSIFALGAWHQYYPVPCVRHLFWAGVPFFGFWVLSFRELWQFQGKHRYYLRLVAVMMLIVFIAAGFTRINAAIDRLAGSSRRPVASRPGIRGMKLTRLEDRMISGVRNVFDRLPAHIKARGVLNYTTDGLWSVILPESSFRHPQFLYLADPLYPDFEEKIQAHIRDIRPVVLLNKPLYLGNYFPAVSWQYMGDEYTLAVPLE